MTVYELIEILESLDGLSEVLLQQTLDLDDDGKFKTLAKLKIVRPAFAAQMELDHMEWDISAYPEIGQTSGEYPVKAPVVVFDS